MQKRSEETRQTILVSALTMFSQSGYEATGVDDICQAAGVSKGAFYHHFPSKQSVFLELLKQWLNNLFASLQKVHLEARTVPEAITDMAAMTPGVFQDADGHLAMFLEFWTQASRDPTIWKATIAPYHRAHLFFVELIQQGISQGHIRPVDPDLAAHTLVSLAIGLLFQGVLDPQGADWPQVVNQSIHLLLKGLERSE